jgi:uncharacterized lipoprotein YehR (DUF1307 family)
MKINIKVSALVFASALILMLSGCEKDGPLESAGESMDESVEDAGEAIDDATDGN